MSKTRVYELAQQMGIDNKELIAKLAAVGVEVKNHMAAIDDADIKKLTAPATVKEVSQEEVRIKPTLIRRRAKVVEAAAEEVVEPTIETAPGEAGIAKAPEEAPPGEAPAKIAEPAKAAEPEEIVSEKPTANRAKILGRMEIPGLTQKPKPQVQREAQQPTIARGSERPDARPTAERPASAQRPEGQRPAPRPDGQRPTGPRPEGQRPAGYTERPISRGPERPGTPRGPERPSTPRGPERPAPIVPLEVLAGADDRRKGRKGKDVVGAAGKKGAAATPVPKRKEEFKKADFDKHERVFEPGPRGKGKRKHAEKVQIGKKTEITTPKAIKRIIKISETITVGEACQTHGDQGHRSHPGSYEDGSYGDNQPLSGCGYCHSPRHGFWL